MFIKCLLSKWKEKWSPPEDVFMPGFPPCVSCAISERVHKCDRQGGELGGGNTLGEYFVYLQKQHPCSWRVRTRFLFVTHLGLRDGQGERDEISSIMLSCRKVLDIVMTFVLWGRDDVQSQISGLCIDITSCV